MNSLNDCIELSLKDSCESNEIDVNFSVQVEGDTWQAYTACISHRDILLFTDKGTCTFLVDSYGTKNTVELFDWNRE